jgi:hypothetical protein
VQRLRQLHKNTYVTPKARANFGQMTAAQKAALDGLGFPFEVPDELKGPDPVDWDGAYEALVAYHKQHRSCMVPQATLATLADGTEVKLGKWVQRQRQVYKNT